MFKIFVWVLSVSCSLWTSYLVHTLTKQKLSLHPEFVFSSKDNSVFIINRPKQFEWNKVPLSTINSNKNKVQALLPHLNNSYSLYISEKQPLILIETKKEWTDQLIKDIFSKAKIHVKKKSEGNWQIEDYEGEVKNNRLLLYKDKPKMSKASFNSSLLDCYSSVSKIIFDNKKAIIKDYYIRNGRIIEYQLINIENNTSKLVDDLEIFSGVVPSKSKNYTFQELSFLKKKDKSFVQSPLSKYVKTGIVTCELNGNPILIFDYKEGAEPIKNLNELFSKKEENKSKAWFKKLLISESLNIKTSDVYIHSSNNFTFISPDSKTLENVLTEISLSKTWRFNEKEMKKFTLDMPKLVNYRKLSDLNQNAIAVIGNKQLSTEVFILSKEEHLNLELNYISIAPDDIIRDFVAYNGPGNMVFLTDNNIVGVQGGKISWKKPIKGKIIGGIKKIPNSNTLKDYFKITTINEIHILNRNGSYINNYLIKRNKSDYSGSGAFYRWNNKNYFAATTFSNELLVYNHNGAQYKQMRLPNIDDWNQIDVYAKSSTIYAAIYGKNKALIVNLDLLKIINTTNVLNEPQIINWKNGTRSIGLDSSTIKLVDEHGTKHSLNVAANKIMSIHGSGQKALVLAKDSNLVKMVDLNGLVVFSKDCSNLNPISASFDINLKGEKFTSFVDAIENNVYLYDGRNQLYPKRIMRGQKKVHLSHFSDKELYVTTILDNKLLQYIIE